MLYACTVSSTPINRYWCMLLRNEGKPVPRWLQTNATWVEGQLRLREEFDQITRRHTTVARFYQVGSPNEVMRNLIDARFIVIEDDYSIVTGMERDEMTRCDRAQAWFLTKGREAPQGRGELDAH